MVIWASFGFDLMRSVRGFSLTEILIIVAIMGIITSFSIYKYQDYLSKSYISEPFSMIETMKARVTTNLQTPNCTYSPDGNWYGNMQVKPEDIMRGKFGMMVVLYDTSRNEYYTTISNLNYANIVTYNPDYTTIPQNLVPEVNDGRECFVAYQFNETLDIPKVLRGKIVRFKFLKNKIVAVEDVMDNQVLYSRVLDKKYLPKDVLYIKAYPR